MDPSSDIEICIVIPCYNEYSMFKIKEYTDFLIHNKSCLICFINDGSTDDTESVLKELQKNFDEQIQILSSPVNVGKAEAVRRGIHFCNANFEFNYIAFLDADLSTSLEECVSLATYLKDDIELAFGSRILKFSAKIVRKRYRFIAGRIIATVISMMLKVKIYDTQCGCKVFSKELSIKLFNEPFISRWLFDVEIFFRMIHLYSRDLIHLKMKEIPLKKWIHSSNSKIELNYIFKIWIDLFKIYMKYKNLKPLANINPKFEQENDSKKI